MISRRSAVAYTFALSVAFGGRMATAGSFEDFFVAIARDDGGEVKALLRRGFDPNILDPKGSTGLTLALQTDSLNAAAALVNAPRTNVDIRNANKETALMLAALRGHLKFVQALITRGAEINHPGWTPLHYAASGTTEKQADIIALLLENHAYIDAGSPNGTTPLMMAARYGTNDAVDLLLSEGADTGLRNQLGLNAIDFALRAERKSTAESIASVIRRRQSGRGRW